MIILGLAGQAGVGKDTIGDYLASQCGFVKFAFSDALYREVAEAFGLEDETLLRDRAAKEIPTPALRLVWCNDESFKQVARRMIAKLYPDTFGVLDDYELAPRDILQWWGTDYRRAQDSDYWLTKAEDWMYRLDQMVAYPEQKLQFFVECGTRFENEREWIKANNGNIWHVHRGDDAKVNNHESTQVLPVLEGERELWNNDTVQRLYHGVDLLMSTSARFVKVEPMEEGT